MKHVLVVGGAGYIGSHVCKYLSAGGYSPVVLDNLSTGHREAVKWGDLYVGSMSDRALLQKIFSTFDIDCVMHFAAHCYVGESVTEPHKYYQNNVAETLTLLDEMLAASVKRFIFSSTCASYGEPVALPISETHPQNPINPYGRSKLMVEQILADFAAAYELKYVVLRYFNAAGADPEGELGEDHAPETHLIPLILNTAMQQGAPLEVFGDDYATVDGTCVRDYIHVEDLAQAHYLAMRRLLAGGGNGCFNLGNGVGFSVKQVIDVAGKVTGLQIPHHFVPRRPGDPAELVGSSERARAELGWAPKFTELHKIVETAWNWYQRYPQGYRCMQDKS